MNILINANTLFGLDRNGIKEDNIVHLLKDGNGVAVETEYTDVEQVRLQYLKIEKERGTKDGKAENKKYFLMNGKIYANRFSTDCFSDYFNDMAKKSKVGLMDYVEYASEKASVEELKMQNSYFINGLYKEQNDESG